MNKKLLLLFTSVSVLYLSSCRKDANEPLQTSDYTNGEMTPDEIANMKAYGVPVRAYNSDVPEQWYNMQLSLIKVTKGFTPPVASRALGYTGLALYESMVNGMPGKKSLGTYLAITPALPVASGLYHWPSVANAALAEIERKLYNNTTDANNAAHLASIDALENSIKSTFQSNPAIAPLIANSETYGRAVADAIFAWSSSDAIGHEGFLHNVDVSYIPITGPGMWVPTPPAYAPCVQPHWAYAST